MQAQDVIGAPGGPPTGNGLTNTSDRIVARLERLPLTSYQHGIFAIVATAWLFDSVDLASLTFVLGSIREEFSLSTRDAGLLSSMSFIGMFLGASIAGIAADRFGRKVVFQISVIFWGLGSLWCSYAPDPQSLGYARLLLGFGMGMEFPVALAIVCEIIPALQRGRYIAILEGFWPIGFITAGLLSLVILPYWGWRGVFLLQAIPALFVFVIRRYVPESPRWLAERGRSVDAEKVMGEIETKVKRRIGGAELPTPRTNPILPLANGAKNSFPLFELWSSDLARRTLMIWTVWFFALLGYYGLTTWLGALLQASGHTVTKSVTYTLLISLAGLPGFATAAWLVEAWGRKPTCVLMLLGSAVCAYLYGHAGSLTQLITFGLGMQFFLFGMWAVLYAYTPELYPTRARATGAGCASAIGRVGALIGPYAVGVVLPYLGQPGVFALGAGSFVVAAAAVWILGNETRGLTLEEIAR
jgi:putative MFS transporter